MNEITNLRIIKHFKDSINHDIHGIYEFDFDDNKQIVIRHGNEFRSINFSIGESIERGLCPISKNLKNVLIKEVEQILEMKN